MPCIADIGSTCIAQGLPIGVQSGARVEGIDLQLAHGGAVAGRVLDARTGAPVAAHVWLYDQDFQTLWVGESGPDGRYATPAWTAGTVYVKAKAVDQDACAYYDRIPCPAGPDPVVVHATPIDLQVDVVREGIDIHLAPDLVFASGFEATALRPAARAARSP